MARQKTVTKTVTLFWWPASLPLKWAESPEEVPPWDVSRGFPALLRWTFDKSRPFRKGHNTYGRNAHIDTRIHTLLDGATDAPIEGERCIAALKYLAGNDWEPLPPPPVGYPRLVRATYWEQNPNGYGAFFQPPELSSLEKYIFISQDEVINELSQLGRQVKKNHSDLNNWEPISQDSQMRSKVREIAEKYGPILNGGGSTQYSNSLQDWVNAGLEIQAYLEAHRYLEEKYFEEDDFEEFRRFLAEEYLKQWKRFFKKGDAQKIRGLSPYLEGENYPWGSHLIPSEASVSHYFEKARNHKLAPLWVSVWGQLLNLNDIRISVSNAPTKLQRMRDELYFELHTCFLGEAKSTMYLNVEAVIICCGALHWALNGLAMLWLTGKKDYQTRICKGCGSFFLTSRTNNKKQFCSSRSSKCRMSYSRAHKK